jgi:membrane-associated PAP2 superfamily phosphatase
MTSRKVRPLQTAPHGRRDALVAALGLLALLAWDASGLDLRLIHAVGTSTGFSLRDAWWTSQVLHDGGRLLGWLVLAALVVNIWRPWWEGPGPRERVTWMLITLVCLLLVPALKRISATSCPWDLQVFGGVAAYVSHWKFGVKDGGPGHCFPSGHAVAAFAFISGWFALRPHAPRAARWWLAGVLVLGRRGPIVQGGLVLAGDLLNQVQRPTQPLTVANAAHGATPPAASTVKRSMKCRWRSWVITGAIALTERSTRKASLKLIVNALR